nr:HNH endonuclease [Mesorhizobium sp. 8]
MCGAEGRITPATVVDHIVRHNGSEALFFDYENTQSLCDAAPWRCHSSRKQSIERRGFDTTIGVDGWPLDARHPGLSGGGGSAFRVDRA